MESDAEFQQAMHAVTQPQLALLGPLSFIFGRALGDRWPAAFKPQTYEKWISSKAETVTTVEELLKLFQARFNELPCVFDEDASFLTRLMGIRDTGSSAIVVLSMLLLGEKELRLNCQLATMIFLDLATYANSHSNGGRWKSENIIQ